MQTCSRYEEQFCRFEGIKESGFSLAWKPGKVGKFCESEKVRERMVNFRICQGIPHTVHEYALINQQIKCGNAISFSGREILGPHNVSGPIPRVKPNHLDNHTSGPLLPRYCTVLKLKMLLFSAINAIICE